MVKTTPNSEGYPRIAGNLSIVDCFRCYFWLELYFTCSGTAAFVSLLSSRYLHRGSKLGNCLCGVDSYGCSYSSSAEEETCPMQAVCLGFCFPQPTRWSKCLDTLVISHHISQVLCSLFCQATRAIVPSSWVTLLLACYWLEQWIYRLKIVQCTIAVSCAVWPWVQYGHKAILHSRSHFTLDDHRWRSQCKLKSPKTCLRVNAALQIQACWK